MSALEAHSLHLGPAFLKTLRSYTIDERRAVRGILGLIQLDPSIDGVRKILLAADAPFTTYISPDFYLFFYVHGTTAFVVDIERANR